MNKTAVMKNWSIISDGNPFKAPEAQVKKLQGFVYGHSRFPDGDSILTSRICKIADHVTHKVISTLNTDYEIYGMDINPDMEAMFPGYYGRLEASK